MRSSAVKKAILDYLAVRPDESVFLRSEFNGLSKSRSGVDKAIRSLVKEGRLVRYGYGLVARAKLSDWTGEYMADIKGEGAFEAMRKLGVPFRLGKAFRDYNERKTTQVPAKLTLDVGKSRITRKIGECDGVRFERSAAPITMRQRILDYLAARPEESVFLRSEFNELSKSRSGVDKALRALVAEGRLVRYGYGLLARATLNDWTGKYMADTRGAGEALLKLGIQFRMGKAFRDYNEGKTTQVPAILIYDVGRARITRKIGGYAGARFERSRAPITLEQRILDYLVARPEESVFLRSEFNWLSLRPQEVDDALGALVAEGRLRQYGDVVVRARANGLTRKPMPATTGSAIFAASRKLERLKRS